MENSILNPKRITTIIVFDIDKPGGRGWRMR